MNKRTIFLTGAGTILLTLFIIFSSSIQDQAIIWYQTRAFGVISYAALFISVLLGELRLLSKNKAKFKLFKYHKPTSIFAITLVGLHFISAIFEKYQWGKTLEFTQYLGFSFTDKWLLFLSLGTLSFYLMAVVGATSARKSIQFLGFKKWKVVHFLSYVSLIFAYTHSVNLGTDIKTSALAPILKPLIILTFFGTLSLLFTRMIVTHLNDQAETNLAAAFIFLLIVGSAFTVSAQIDRQEKLNTLEQQLATAKIATTAAQEELPHIQEDINTLKNEIEVITWEKP